MNAFSLHNKTALITGAASGLGLAMAKCMIVSGAKVIIADLNGELAQATAGTLGSQASWIQMDVGDTAAAQEKVDVLISEHGAIDILVNNAGNHCKKPIEEMSVSDFESVLDVHVVGAFALTKALVPHMKQRGKGCVLFTASMTSFLGQPLVTGYSAAKFGGVGLTQSLALDLAEYGITVHSLMLGNLLKSPMFQSLLPQYATKLGIKPEQVEQYYIDKVPLKRGCDYQDVLNMLLFYASPKASYCTGQSINVTGGQVMF